MRRAPAILLAMMLWAMPAQAATAQEQEGLLEESLAIIALELGGNYDHLGHLVLPSRNGGQLELAFGRDDPGFGASAAACIHEGDPGRQHPLGSTVLTELRVLDSATLQRFLEDNQDKAPKGNVSSSFLVHHWRALQLSARADDIEGLRVALLEEARALSYLMDAFSSNNFFFPGRDPLDWLHSVNNRERRRAFQFMGAYVMDSRGEVWQSFGDRLLQWHPKSLEMVELAVLAALREFFAVYYGESAPLALATWRDEHSPRDDALAWVASWLEPSDGVVFYQEHRMPSLLHIPMAISATWSERDPSRVEHGIASRLHWPQLKDAGGHDPDLTAQLVARLPAGDELPTWLHFPLLKTSSPSRLLLENPDVASVRFEQQVSIPPTFKGGLLVFGLGSNLRGENSTWLLSGGLGWGIADQLLPLRQLLIFQRMSVELRGNWDPNAADAYGVLALATQLNAPDAWGALHLELGLVDGWQGRYSGWGMHFSIGLASRSVKLPGFYLGGATRLRYSVGYMDEVVHTILLDFLVH